MTESCVLDYSTAPKRPQKVAQVGPLHCPEFFIKGQTRRCAALIERREHVLVGISPFNSRFSEDYVISLLNWARRNFLQVDVLLPDPSSASLLLIGSGDAEGKALRKARKEVSRHRRFVARAADILEKRGNIRIVEFADCACFDSYLSIRASVERAYEECEMFRSACLHMSSMAIQGRLRGVEKRASTYEGTTRVDAAVRYIAMELPFYLNTPEILNVGSSVLAYHRQWPIWEALASGGSPLSIDPRQAHGIVSLAQ